MNFKQLSGLQRVSIVTAALFAWVGLALLVSFVASPSWDSSVTRPVAVASAPPEEPPPPSFIFTQFVAGSPLTLATQAPNGSLVVVTQYPVEPLVIHGPDRYYTIDPDGTKRGFSLLEFQRRVPGDVRSLGLFDHRYQPEINLDDLK